MFNLDKNDKIIFNSQNSDDLSNYVKKVIEVRNHWNNRKDLINLHKDETFSKLLKTIEEDIKYLLDCFSKNIYDNKCEKKIDEYENTKNPFMYLSYVDDFCIPCNMRFSIVKYNLFLDYLKNFFKRHINMINNYLNISMNNIKENYINSLQQNKEEIEKNSYYNVMGLMGEIAVAIMLGLNFNHCFKIRKEIGTLNQQDSGDLNYNGCFIDIKTTDSIYNNLIIDDSKQTINNNRIDVYFLVYFNSYNNSYTFLGAIPHKTAFKNDTRKLINGVQKIYINKKDLMSFKDAYIIAMNSKLNNKINDVNIKPEYRDKMISRLNYINNGRINWTKNVSFNNNNQMLLDQIILSTLSKLHNANVNITFTRKNKPQINIFNDPNKDIKGFFVYSNQKNYNRQLIKNVFDSKYPGYLKFYNKKAKP